MTDRAVDECETSKDFEDEQLSSRKSLQCTIESTNSDSGVLLEGAISSEVELFASTEKESDLDLSRILDNLSPISAQADDANGSVPQFYEIREVCDDKRKQLEEEGSDEGSENEEPNQFSVANDLNECNKENFNEKPYNNSATTQSPSFLDISSPGCDRQPNSLNQASITNASLPLICSIPSLSNQPYYYDTSQSSMSPYQLCSSPAHPSLSTFQTPSISPDSNVSQASPGRQQKQQPETTQPAPSNEERISFLRGLSQATLWHFVLDCLSKPSYYNSVCAWASHPWQFCITHTKRFTEKWDEYNCNRQPVSYVKVSRALKSFESTQFAGFTLLRRVSAARNTFRFLPDHNSPHIPHIRCDPQVSAAPPFQQQQSSLATISPLFPGAPQSIYDPTFFQNYPSPFDYSSRVRMPIQPSTAETYHPVMRSNQYRRTNQRYFPYFTQGFASSTPIRDSNGFGRDLSNTAVQWSYQPPSSFAPPPFSYAPTLCQQNQCADQGQINVFEHNASSVRPSDSQPMPFYQSSQQSSYAYGTPAPRLEAESSGMRQVSSGYASLDNRFDSINYASNASNDSAFYEESQSSFCKQTQQQCTSMLSNTAQDNAQTAATSHPFH